MFTNAVFDQRVERKFHERKSAIGRANDLPTVSGRPRTDTVCLWQAGGQMKLLGVGPDAVVRNEDHHCFEVETQSNRHVTPA